MAPQESEQSMSDTNVQSVAVNLMANKARKVPVTHKDLTALVLFQGPDALDPLLADHTDPVGVLEKVIATFKANGKDTESLEAKLSMWEEIKTPGTKGRKPARPGDVRCYKAQQIGEDGDLFIRLPVGLTGASKGSNIAVRFNIDGSMNVELEAE